MMLRKNNGLTLLGTLASGEPVYDRYNSHLHEDVKAFLAEAFSKIESNKERFTVRELDFGRVIGNSSCVPTSEKDTIVYAFRPKRNGATRFVKNRKPEPCSTAVVILKRNNHEPYYVLITAFIGHASGPEPWDARATDANREFWRTHALVWGSEEVIPGTETAICPW